MEEWRPVPSHPGYEASSLGHIRSVDRMVAYNGPTGVIYQRCARGRTLMLTPRPSGHLHFSVERRGKEQVHVAVAEAFLGPCPEGLECRHLDGDPGNNKLSNLAYGTHMENIQDKFRHGTQPQGGRCYNSKLTDDDVRWIRAHKGEMSTHAMAKKFGVSQSVLFQAQAGKTWRHI